MLEQAAGLLQDISHTAFSHTIDYLFKNRNEEFHESLIAKMVINSDLPEIFERHGLSWQDAFNASNLKIVEAKAPLLCADRIDYTLRDLVRFGRITSHEAMEFVGILSVHEGVIVGNDIEKMKAFVHWYAYLVERLFMNPLELYAHDEFAAMLAVALERGILREEDIFGTDDAIIDKLQNCPPLHQRLNELQSTKQVIIDDRGGHRIYSKGRIIDPPILIDGRVVCLSQILPTLSLLWANILKISADGVAIRKVG